MHHPHNQDSKAKPEARIRGLIGSGPKKPGSVRTGLTGLKINLSTLLFSQVKSSLPLPLRIMVFMLILGLLIYLAITPLQFSRTYNEAEAERTQSLFAGIQHIRSQVDVALERAESGMITASRLSANEPDQALNGTETGLDISHGTLKSLALMKSDGTLLALSGNEDHNKLSKIAQAAKTGRPNAPRIDIMAISSRLSRQADTYVTMSWGPDQPLAIGRLKDLFADFDNGRDNIALISDEKGMIVAGSDPSLTRQNLKSALGVSLESLRNITRQASTLTGSRDQHGYVQLAGSIDDAHNIVLVFGQPGQGIFTSHSALFKTALFVIGPLLVGVIFIGVLLFSARHASSQVTQSRQSENRFRLAVEAARCGIWEWDLAADNVYLSDVTGIMFGWGGAGVVKGSDLIARIDPQNRNLMIMALEGARSNGALDVSIAIPGEVRPLWIDMRGQAVGDRDQNGFVRLSGVALDVSEERIAQIRAQRAEARLVDAINSVSDAFVLWDRRSRLVMWNRTFANTFRIEPTLLKPGSLREPIEGLISLAIRKTHSTPDDRKGVYEAELYDGRWMQISESTTKEGGRVLTFADITAIKNQEEMRRRNEVELKAIVDKLEIAHQQQAVLTKKYEMAKVRAESANHAKSEFLANMSHELRTPLNAINGFSEIMAGEMFGPLGHPRYKEYSGDILSSGQHLLALINDILDMSKIEAGKMTMRFEAIDVSEVIDDTLRLVLQRAEKAGLKLKLLLPPHLPELEADYRALKQILLNLMTNAIKFTPPGGAITISATATEASLHIQVQDTGIGIDRKDMDRLARPFEQIENQMSKTREGTGLGLALTKSLIEMHSGRLEVDSELGKGTLVTIILPRQQGLKTLDADSLGADSIAPRTEIPHETDQHVA